MPYARLALILAVLTAAIGLGELVYFSPGYLPRQWLPIILWAAVPALGVPAYQNALLLAGLLIAWIVEQRFRSASA